MFILYYIVKNIVLILPPVLDFTGRGREESKHLLRSTIVERGLIINFFGNILLSWSQVYLQQFWIPTKHYRPDPNSLNSKQSAF